MTTRINGDEVHAVYGATNENGYLVAVDIVMRDGTTVRYEPKDGDRLTMRGLSDDE